MVHTIRESLRRFAPFGAGAVLLLSSAAYLSSSPGPEDQSSSSSSSSSSPSSSSNLRRATTTNLRETDADSPHSGGGDSQVGKTSAAGKNSPMVGGGGSEAGADGEPPLPHIVLFFVDDMGFNDIGYNSYDIPDASPFLTDLASTGIKLTHYYTE